MNILPQRQVHLDFHTSECIDAIGSMFDAEQFKSCLKKGHINSITIFAKCHHGWAYFPSEKNTMHPGLNFDLLSSMLKACKEIGVESPIYISAGLDEHYFVDHPEYQVLYEKDKPLCKAIEENGRKYIENEGWFHELCMNTPYLDVLAEQVKEVVEKFDPIGIFLDIVGERLCFCEHCKATAKELGLDIDNPDDHKKLAQITYKKYYETINNAARSVKPDVRIFHNSGHISYGRRDLAHVNTHLELESLPTGGWGYDHFPMSAKYASSLNMEYLGMTGKFHLSWGEFGGFKHPNALRYEVALSLANGAKCSIGDQMHPYGFLDDATYELIGTAYKEAEKVEEYCYGVTSVADIALLSIESVLRGTAQGENSRNFAADTGAGRMLLEGKYLYDVIDPECDFSKYKLIILPDAIVADAELKNKLKAYASNGGKVLCTGISGTDTNGDMIFDLGVKIKGKSKFNPSYYHPTYNAIGLSPSNYIMYSTMYDTELTDENAEVLGYSRNSFFNRGPKHFCSHFHTPFVMENNSPALVIGKDGGYISYEIFSEYEDRGSIILKDTVICAIDKILGDDKTLKTNLTSGGTVTLNSQTDKNRDILHMLYALPTKRGKNVEIIEDLPTVNNTTFEIKTGAVKSVTLVPQNKEIPFEYKNGILSFTIDQFECSQIAVIKH